MLDSCVYIDELHDRVPTDIVARVERRGVFHSLLALSELSFSFGRFDPKDSRTAKVLDKIRIHLSPIHDQRLLVPSSKAMMRGAILAGSISRILCYKEEQRLKGFNDAMIATHAIEEQLLLITRNIANFDRLSQLGSKLKVAFYRI